MAPFLFQKAIELLYVVPALAQVSIVSVCSLIGKSLLPKYLCASTHRSAVHFFNFLKTRSLSLSLYYPSSYGSLLYQRQRNLECLVGYTKPRRQLISRPFRFIPLLNSTQGTRQQSSDKLRNLALSKCEITMLQI